MNKRNWLKRIIVTAAICTTTVFAGEQAPVKGNPDSKIYHKAACRHYTAKSSTKAFKSEPEAVKAGYNPCKQCSASKTQKKNDKEK